MRRLILGMAIAGFTMLTPCWLLAGDQDVAQQIAANLKNSGKMHGYSIGVKVKDGTVWLNGTVKSPEQRNTALDIVQDTPGLQKIVDGLTVTGTSQARQTTDDGNAQSGGGQADYRQADYNRPEIDWWPRTVMGPPRANGAPLPLAMGPHMASICAVRKAPGEMMASAPNGNPIPAYTPGPGGGVAPAHFDHPQMPGYAWPSYASYPNYAAVTYPRQYSPTAWPFIGPFYPYPQVPLGWRKVTLEWHNGWWMLDFNDGCDSKF